jgi:hypothetical protein
MAKTITNEHHETESLKSKNSSFKIPIGADMSSSIEDAVVPSGSEI